MSNQLNNFVFTTLYQDSHILQIAGIFTLESNGTFVWHDLSKVDEAAVIFKNMICNVVEDLAGIKQTRKQWEEEYIRTLIIAAKENPLTEKQLTDIYKERILIDKLIG